MSHRCAVHDLSLLKLLGTLRGAGLERCWRSIKIDTMSIARCVFYLCRWDPAASIILRMAMLDRQVSNERTCVRGVIFTMPVRPPQQQKGETCMCATDRPGQRRPYVSHDIEHVSPPPPPSPRSRTCVRITARFKISWNETAETGSDLMYITISARGIDAEGMIVSTG